LIGEIEGSYLDFSMRQAIEAMIQWQGERSLEGEADHRRQPLIDELQALGETLLALGSVEPRESGAQQSEPGGLERLRRTLDLVWLGVRSQRHL